MKKLLLAVALAAFATPALANKCLPFMFSTTDDIRFCEVADPGSDLCRVISYADLQNAVGNNKSKQAVLLQQEAQDWIDVRFDLTGPVLDGDDGRDPYKDANPDNDAEFWSDADGTPMSLGASHVTVRSCVIENVRWLVEQGIFVASARRVTN